jgi:hypothetical protein
VIHLYGLRTILFPTLSAKLVTEGVIDGESLQVTVSFTKWESLVGRLQ